MANILGALGMSVTEAAGQEKALTDEILSPRSLFGLLVERSRQEVSRTWDTSPGSIAAYDYKKIKSTRTTEVQNGLINNSSLYYVFLFHIIVYVAETKGNGNSLTFSKQQDEGHNGGNCNTYVSHLTVVEGEGRQRLG